MKNLQSIYKSLGFFGCIITPIMFFIFIINIYMYATTLSTFNLILLYSSLTLFLINFSYISEEIDISILKQLKIFEAKFMKRFVFNTLWFLSLLMCNELFITTININMKSDTNAKNFKTFELSKECEKINSLYYLNTTIVYQPYWFNIEKTSKIYFTNKTSCEEYLKPFLEFVANEKNK